MMVQNGDKIGLNANPGIIQYPDGYENDPKYDLVWSKDGQGRWVGNYIEKPRMWAPGVMFTELDGLLGLASKLGISDMIDSVLRPIGNPDVNQDGIVDIYDFGYLQNVLHGADRFVGNVSNASVRDNYFRCDLNGDGVIDENDLLWLFR